MFKPLNDRVVIERIKEEEVTPSGLFIPEAAQQKPQKGRVISVGKGKILPSGVRVEPEVKEGDLVIFQRHASETKIDGQTYVLIKEDEILGVYEQE